jgi:hypothetical protein
VNASSRTINMTDLVARSGLTAQSLVNTAVCAKLADYRQTIGIAPSSVGILTDKDLQSIGSSRIGVFTPTTSSYCPMPVLGDTASTQVLHNHSDTAFPRTSFGGGEYFADYDDDNNHNHMLDDDYSRLEPQTLDDEGSALEPPPLPLEPTSSSSASLFEVAIGRANSAASTPTVANVASNVTTPPVALFSPPRDRSKLEWTAPSAEDQLRRAIMDLNDLKVSSVNTANDYAFFAVDDLVSDDNSWAGARHWSYRTRSRNVLKTQQQALDTISETSSVSAGSEMPMAHPTTKAKSKTASKKKVSDVFSLSLDLVDPSHFASSSSSRSRVDTTRLTKASLEKNVANASTLLLPADEQLKVQDLCRLFLLPTVVVPPRNVHLLGRGKAVPDDARGNKARQLVDSLHGDDMVWRLDNEGIVMPESSDGLVNSLPPILEGEEDRADYDAGDYEVYDDDGDTFNPDSHEYLANNKPFSQDEHTSNPIAAVSTLEGLEIDHGNLIQATRTVEKIDIK